MTDAIEVWTRTSPTPAVLRDIVAGTPGLRVGTADGMRLTVTRGILRRPSFTIVGPVEADFGTAYPHLAVTGLEGRWLSRVPREECAPAEKQFAIDVASRLAATADGFVVDVDADEIRPRPRVAHDGVDTSTMSPTWDDDVLRALRGVRNFRVVFSPSQVAARLWEYGEDGLADRALTMDRHELLAIRRLSAVYDDSSYPLPVEGRRITRGHVDALAAIAFFEGRLRPLARTRRRAQKSRPERFTPVMSPPGDDLGERNPDGTVRQW